MIRNILFDIGNVLLVFKPAEYLKATLEDWEEAGKLHQAVFRSGEWIELDRGSLTCEEAADRICLRHPDLEAHIRRLLVEWPVMLRPVPETVTVLKALKSLGYRAYYLSNFHEDAFERIQAEYDFFQYFDGGIVSASVKQIKPDEAIYRILLETYGLSPEECVFIDDMPENIEAAEKLGIKAIRLTDAAKLSNALAVYGVLAGSERP